MWQRHFVVALFWLGFLIPSRSVYAVEIQTFFDTQCVPRSGVLLRVDETHVRFVALDGGVGELPREAITAVVTHRTLENPLSRITLLGSTRLLLRDVWLGNDETPTFVGWPVGFFENLIVFLDLEGTTHVLEREDIGKIRVIRRSIQGEVWPALSAPVKLGIPDGLIPCRTTAIDGPLRPTRAIGDPIKVSEYLSKLAELFREVDGFEERTRVYARPFLFDRTMRLGLSYLRKGGNGLPLYFQWSSGRPYRFQSLTAIGRISNPSLPHPGPSLSVRSDLKSHFFHAYFAGHLPSLSAGSNAFVANELIPRSAGVGSVDDLYNYLMLMGGDWGPWSLSIGTLYRNFRFSFLTSRTQRLNAEVGSKVLRLGFTARSYALRFLYFRTRQSGSVESPEDAYENPWNGSSEGYPNSVDPILNDPRKAHFAYFNTPPVQHRFRMDTLRVGVIWDPKAWLQIGADEIISWGQYWEGNSQGQTTLKIFQGMTHLFLRQTFSEYISVMGLITFRNFHNSTTPDVGIRAFTDFDLGGAIEFLF